MSDIKTLKSLYSEFQIPVDQLALDEVALEKFAKRFNEATNHSCPKTEILRLLLSARKRSQLRRLQRSYFGRGTTRTQVAVVNQEVHS